jgi:hypothetical protein
MREELYADGIGEITVTGSIVRVDFVSLSATQKDANNNPQAVVRQRIIMPGDAFANAVNLMQQALNGLTDAGLVQRGAGAGAAAPGAIAPNGNASPNFS